MRLSPELKTGVTVTLGFFGISLVILVLASFAFGPGTQLAPQTHAGSDVIRDTESAERGGTIGLELQETETAEYSKTETAEFSKTETAEYSKTETIDTPDDAKPTPHIADLAEKSEPVPPAILRSPPETTALEPTDQSPDAVRDLPSLLSTSDADRYRRIFALQRRGKVTEAKKIVANLDSKLLMGHVLAQRLQRQSNPKTSELRRWLRKYSDHPDYGRIKRLSQARNKRNSRKLRPPRFRSDSLIAAPPRANPYRTRKNLTRKQRKRVSSIKRTARIWLRRGQISRTERMLGKGYVVRLLDRYEMSEARGKVAAAWFYHGKDARAYRIAKQVIARSGKKLPVTHWIAGLASWRMGKFEQALKHFEKVAVAPKLSGWIGAGGALWAARAHKKLGNEQERRRWLQEAAKHPYTLYGVLALTKMGLDIPFEPRNHPLTEDKVKLLSSTKGGRRALALSEVGEKLRAEQELLLLREWKRPGMENALRAIADRLQLPSIAIKLTRHSKDTSEGGWADEPLDPALYPIPPWQPSAKSGIDRALLFAVMRQESDFNAFAHSPVGALGLMQIMPDTARMLNKGRRPFRGSRRLDQYDPKTIIKFGQRYLIHLRTHKNVRHDLLRVIAAYNSGPGNIGYWARTRMKHQKDPLMFIETIPNLETRLFVRRVITNLWVYRRRLEQDTPTLDAMVAGKFPRYRPIDKKRRRRASAGQHGNSDG